MITPELQSDVAKKVVGQFHKWSDHYGQDRYALALEQTLLPASLLECLQPFGRTHLSGPEVRKIVSVFQSMEGFSDWLDDALEPFGDRDTNVLRIVAVARRARTKGESVIPPSPTPDHLK